MRTCKRSFKIMSTPKWLGLQELLLHVAICHSQEQGQEPKNGTRMAGSDTPWKLARSLGHAVRLLAPMLHRPGHGGPRPAMNQISKLIPRCELSMLPNLSSMQEVVVPQDCQASPYPSHEHKRYQFIRAGLVSGKATDLAFWGRSAAGYWQADCGQEHLPKKSNC